MKTFVDDEHSDREPERDWPAGFILQFLSCHG